MFIGKKTSNCAKQEVSTTRTAPDTVEHIGLIASPLNFGWKKWLHLVHKEKMCCPNTCKWRIMLDPGNTEVVLPFVWDLYQANEYFPLGKWVALGFCVTQTIRWGGYPLLTLHFRNIMQHVRLLPGFSWWRGKRCYGGDGMSYRHIKPDFLSPFLDHPSIQKVLFCTLWALVAKKKKKRLWMNLVHTTVQTCTDMEFLNWAAAFF